MTDVSREWEGSGARARPVGGELCLPCGPRRFRADYVQDLLQLDLHQQRLTEIQQVQLELMADLERRRR
jgi:hypothetical protein